MKTIQLNSKIDDRWRFWTQNPWGELIVRGPTVPTAGSKGYAPGCIFIDENGSDVNSLMYVNLGTKASCSFLPYNNDLNALAATAVEINRTADVSTRLVASGTTLNVTVADHADKVIVAAGTATINLPAATGTGARFLIRTGAVAVSVTIAALAGDLLRGTLFGVNTDDDSVTGITAATEVNIVLDGHAQGGALIGDWIELVDEATDKWQVTGVLTCDEAFSTPLS